MTRGLLTLALLVVPWTSACAQDVPLAYASVSAAHVHFETDAPGIALSRADGAGAWIPLGVSPCDFTLPSGAIQLALAFENRAPTRVPIALDLEDGTRLLGHYESRQLLRELGVGVVLGTIALVLVGIAIGANGLSSGTPDVGVAGLVAGGAVGVVGLSAGITLATLDDIATIDVL